MTISQMIQKLEKIREERGDLRVMVESHVLQDAELSVSMYRYSESMAVGEPFHHRYDEIVVSILPAPIGCSIASVTAKT